MVVWTFVGELELHRISRSVKKIKNQGRTLEIRAKTSQDETSTSREIEKVQFHPLLEEDKDQNGYESSAMQQHQLLYHIKLCLD